MQSWDYANISLHYAVFWRQLERIQTFFSLFPMKLRTFATSDYRRVHIIVAWTKINKSYELKLKGHESC